VARNRRSLSRPAALLRRDDVQQVRCGNLHIIDNERSTRGPHRLEVVAFHDEREIDLQAWRAGAPRQGPPLDDSLREPAVSRAIERFVRQPEIHPHVFTRGPRSNEVVGIGGAETDPNPVW
jgi:hypothetical protein